MKYKYATIYYVALNKYTRSLVMWKWIKKYTCVSSSYEIEYNHKLQQWVHTDFQRNINDNCGL